MVAHISLTGPFVRTYVLLFSLVDDVEISSFYLLWLLSCTPIPYFKAQDSFTYLVMLSH